MGLSYQDVKDRLKRSSRTRTRSSRRARLPGHPRPERARAKAASSLTGSATSPRPIKVWVDPGKGDQWLDRHRQTELDTLSFRGPARTDPDI